MIDFLMITPVRIVAWKMLSRGYMSATASHYPHDLSISSPKSEEDTNLTDRLVEYFGGKILPKSPPPNSMAKKSTDLHLIYPVVIPLEFVSSVMNQNLPFAILLQKTL